MSTDPELRERFERAVTHVRVDTERRLDEIHHSTDRRKRVHQASIFAAAAMLALIVVVTFLQVRSSGDGSYLAPGTSAPSGRIAYGRSADPLHPETGSDLFVVDAASGEQSTLDDGAGSALAAQWSPDGSSIAFIAEENDGQRFAIIVERADGSQVRILERPKAEGTLGPDLISLSWSPDGSRIAYSGRSPGRGRTVSIINADGSGGSTLGGHWEGVSWAPDGGSLLLTGWPEFAAETEQFDLYVVRPDGSPLRRLTEDRDVERSASWSPDSTQIVFAKGVETAGNVDYEQDVYVMDADGSDMRRITDWDGLDLFPVWSPDGNWIAFASDRGATEATQSANRSGTTLFGGVSIYVMRPDGSDARRLLNGGDLRFFPLSWTS